MGILVTILGRTIFFSKLLFAPQGIQAFPRKSCIISIPVGPSWMSPVVRGISEVIINYKLIATQASLNEEEAAQENLNLILAAIENSPRSCEDICATYLDKLCNAGKHSVAARLLCSLQVKNVFPGTDSYNLVMAAAGNVNKIAIVSQVFLYLIISCEYLPSSSYLNLAKGFINTNDRVLLLRLVNEVSQLTFSRITVVMNRIIFAFAESRQFDKALLIFDHIKDSNCKPDLITYNTVLDILGRAGRIDEMLNEFSSMKEAGIFPDFISYNTLLNQLQKAGRLDLCLVYMREMSDNGIKPDLLTYTALIQGFGKTGNIEVALRLFKEMKENQIRPSIYIYRSLINRSKKMGMVDLAMTLLKEMNESLPDLAGPNEFKRKRR